MDRGGIAWGKAYFSKLLPRTGFPRRIILDCRGRKAVEILVITD